jgi:hypothetical protein
MDIPEHIVGLIITKSSVSIDTSLEFRKFGVIPKKLVIEECIKNKLDKILQRRVKAYANKKELKKLNSSYGYFLESFSIDMSNDKVIEIYIDDVNGDIIYGYEISQLDHELREQFTLRRQAVDIHTGEYKEFSDDESYEFYTQ